MGRIDRELLVPFIGLFIVNAALPRTGLTARRVAAVAAHGWPGTRHRNRSARRQPKCRRPSSMRPKRSASRSSM